MAKQNEIVEEKAKRYEAPAVDIRETDAAYLVIANVPGADESATTVTLEKDRLEFTANSAFAEPENLRGAYREFRGNNYRREFHLNVDVDRDNIKATVQNGVLRISLPKKQPVVKNIEVKAA